MNMHFTSGALGLVFLFLFPFSNHAQTPGSLDAQFGSGGTVQAAFSTFSADCRTMALQTDGKILLGGLYTSGGTATMGFVRFNANGTPDNGFGTAGKATVPIGTTGVKLATLQITTGGKILAAGSNNNKPAILRLSSAGVPDNTFGASGLLAFDGGLAGILDLVVLPSGKMVGCGIADQGSGKMFAAFRLNADGSPDNTFGTGGFAYYNAGDQPTLTRMAVQSDGKILMTGTVYTASTVYDLVLVRLAANGTPDNTFGTNGKVVTILSTNQAYEQGNAIAVQSDGKIVVAARIANAGPTVFAVVRYSAAGIIENGFGTGGSTKINFNNSVDEPKAVAVQSDGKIVVVGSSVNGSNRDIALARLTKTGAPDNTFDSDGKVTTALGTKAYGEAMALQPDGKIVVGGYATISGLSQLFAARYNAGSIVGTQEIESGLHNLQVFPNPATSGAELRLKFRLDQIQDCRFLLFGADGRLIKSYPAEKLEAGSQTVLLNIPGNIPSGSYWLRIETAQGTASVPVQVN